MIKLCWTKMVAGEESDSEYMWKEELIEFTDGLDKRYE